LLAPLLEQRSRQMQNLRALHWSRVGAAPTPHADDERRGQRDQGGCTVAEERQ
jgi:hypothetical protein